MAILTRDNPQWMLAVKVVYRLVRLVLVWFMWFQRWLPQTKTRLYAPGPALTRTLIVLVASIAVFNLLKNASKSFL